MERCCRNRAKASEGAKAPSPLRAVARSVRRSRMGIASHETLDRQSVHVYAGPDETGADEPGFYVSMLEEDVQLGLMPIGGRIRKTDQLCVRLLSGADEAPRELQGLVA